MLLRGHSLPLDHLSPTSLSAFASCPEQWRRKYLQKEPDFHSGERFMGSVNHDTIAAILTDVMRGDFNPDPGLETPEYVRSYYRYWWETRLDTEGEPYWNGDDPNEMYARGLQMAIAYVEVVVPEISPLAVEERLELDLPGLPTVIGYVDVIEANKIRERKTTAQKQTTPKPRWRFQARVYQLMLGLPVEWDVITRQAATKLYGYCEEYPELRFELCNAETTVSMIRSLWEQMNACLNRYGPDGTWPLLGQFGTFDCQYCRYGPRHRSDCPAWS